LKDEWINRMIDEIDRQILALLQEDARLSNAALAEKVGSTSSTVHERVKKLERRGIIKGYVAVVDPQLVGKTITAFIRLTVGLTAQGYMESKNGVMEICLSEPNVLECHGVAGEDCYILKVRVANPQELEKLIERIRTKAQISRTITSIVLSTIKETTALEPEGTYELQNYDLYPKRNGV
jgi:Lrp/AsnC family leucine-responsive transcriptional regulator